tara:strand:- start:60 stop:827 length:768 start_codon:yes stop_codon:yes gene_type:complete
MNPKLRKFLSKIINDKFLKKFDYKIIKLQSNKIEEATSDENLLIEKCMQYSMTPYIRMWTLINSINYVSSNNIEGDFVECGVWKGGNLILYNQLNKKKNLNRKIYGYDTFEGMSTPSRFDFKDNTSSQSYINNLYNQKTNSKSGWSKSTIDEVKENILTESSLENINLIKGKVEDTLLNNNNVPEKISILRLDTDFYESTKMELEVLFPRLEKNGILIIDDYGFKYGARKAVDEYFKKKPFLIYVDHDCRLLIKN